MIGDALTEAGCEAEVSPANGVYDPTGIDAVIVVGRRLAQSGAPAALG